MKLLESLLTSIYTWTKFMLWERFKWLLLNVPYSLSLFPEGEKRPARKETSVSWRAPPCKQVRQKGNICFSHKTSAPPSHWCHAPKTTYRIWRRSWGSRSAGKWQPGLERLGWTSPAPGKGTASRWKGWGQREGETIEKGAAEVIVEG